MPPPLPTDPNAYRVQHVRASGGKGALVEIIVVQVLPHGGDGPALNRYSSCDDMDRFIARAAKHESTNPFDNQMPSDRAIILAALDDCGIEASEEEDASSPADEATRDLHEMVTQWSGHPEAPPAGWSDTNAQLRVALKALLAAWDKGMATGWHDSKPADAARALLAKTGES